MRVPLFIFTAVVLTTAKVAALQVPSRSPQAGKDLVDLSNHYSAPLTMESLGRAGLKLDALPQGLEILAQGAFDVRGMIQLAGEGDAGDLSRPFPRQVTGIKINHRGTSLQFLHGTIGRVPDETKIAEYVLHYASGKSVRLPLHYQRQLRDVLVKKGEPLPTDAEVAWMGKTNADQPVGSTIQLYRYLVMNPYPEEEIVSLDLISAMTGSRPFLIAVSLATDKAGSGFRKAFRRVRIDNKIMPRDAAAGPELIDLSAHFNTSTDDDWINYPGHDFQDLPKGIQTLAGVKFDVRGMVVLASGQALSSSRVLFPEAVNNIAVDRTARRLHFLQGCGYSDKPGANLGAYIIHYVDGETRSAEVVYQQNVLDWWTRSDDVALPEAVEAWRGGNPSSLSAGRGTHLFKYTWENPRADVKITTIDFVTHFAIGVPFLIALTVE